MNKKIAAVSFAAGTVFGSLITIGYAKSKYEKLYQEELESVKETYSKAKDVAYEDEKSVAQVFADASEQVNKATSALHDFPDKIAELGYSNLSDEKETPYVISPEEYGEYDDYETISLTYYNDGVLADENDEIVDDVSFTVGDEAMDHFGEYEDDSVFIRNDKLKSDYEILKDYRNYSDIAVHTKS